MSIQTCHPWPQSAGAAVEIQQQPRSRVVMVDYLGPVRSVAGVDVGFEENSSITRAAVAVLSWPDLLQAQAIERRPTTFPYIPCLLSFREAPAGLDALTQLSTIPDLLLCDRLGIAP